MPPMPGSGLTYDGSVRDEEGSAPTYVPPLASGSLSDSSSAKVNVSVSTTGNKKLLVLLAGFPDLAFNQGITAQTHNTTYYRNLLQDSSGLTMKKYYLEQSRNKLNLSFLVLGGAYPYEAQYGYAYYGGNNQVGNDRHPAELVQEMLKVAKTDPLILGEDLDNCVVIVVHAGRGEEEGGVSTDFIWSHRNSLTKNNLATVTIGSKTFDDYIIVPEYTKWRNNCESSIGVFCHEFGHILGLPDAYDTAKITSGVGEWSLMGGGSWGSVGKAGLPPGTDPAPLMAWERLALGWIDEEQIILGPGESNTYSFANINNESKVYTIKLTDNQFLLFEGKKENMTGLGMCVMESGLMVTQMHKTILSNYWSKNTINYGSYRPHGVMIVEAVAENYKTNGLGNLWRYDSTDNRFTTTALFRKGTLTELKPDVKSKNASIPFLPIFFDTIIASGVVIGLLAVWYAGRKKLCAALAVAITAALISMSCVIEAGTGGGGTYDTGPNTNYYTSTFEVHSKTGYSGITIYNIKSNSDGSGSFSVRKAQ